MDTFIQAVLVYVTSLATALVAVAARAMWEWHSQRMQAILYILHLRNDLIVHLYNGNVDLLKGEVDELIGIRRHFSPNEDAVHEIAIMRSAYVYATTTRRDDPKYQIQLKDFIAKLRDAERECRLSAAIERSPLYARIRSRRPAPDERADGVNRLV